MGSVTRVWSVSGHEFICYCVVLGKEHQQLKVALNWSWLTYEGPGVTVRQLSHCSHYYVDGSCTGVGVLDMQLDAVPGAFCAEVKLAAGGWASGLYHCQAVDTLSGKHHKHVCDSSCVCCSVYHVSCVC